MRYDAVVRRSSSSSSSSSSGSSSSGGREWSYPNDKSLVNKRPERMLAPLTPKGLGTGASFRPDY